MDENEYKIPLFLEVTLFLGTEEQLSLASKRKRTEDSGKKKKERKAKIKEKDKKNHIDEYCCKG